MDIGKKTLKLNKNLAKQEGTETEFEDSINRSEKKMQNSFVLEILRLETEISEVCSACKKCLTVLPNLFDLVDSLGDLQANKGDKLIHCSLHGNLLEKQSSIYVLNILEL